MKNKKKALIAIISVILAAALIAGGTYLFVARYAFDKNDTEELYRQNVASVGYENTIETAYPQTDLYTVIEDHFTSELPEGKTEKKAVVIGYDGCRADVLTQVQNENSAVSLLLSEGGSKNLVYCGGVNYPEINTQDTSTAPGWCSILTGVWADKHGVTANGITKSLDTKTLLTSLTENKIIDSASFITRWKGHFSKDNSTYRLEKEYCETNGLPVSFNHCKNDEASHEFVMKEVKGTDCADFVFVIYEHTDATGHSRGFSINNPKYQEAFRSADACAYETIQAIKSRETYDNEDWLIILTSDHGGFGLNHGKESIQERMTFIVTNKELN
ncbi:MAG: alkaline phosphatase family protein [Clostridia bacterium]|nr:alkaline phosphatase family protein [Clostridia bacterium]